MQAAKKDFLIPVSLARCAKLSGPSNNLSVSSLQFSALMQKCSGSDTQRCNPGNPLKEVLLPVVSSFESLNENICVNAKQSFSDIASGLQSSSLKSKVNYRLYRILVPKAI